MPTPASHNPQSLTPGQIAVLALYGTTAWFAAAMLVRTLGPMEILDGAWGLLTYLLVIPGSVPAILIARSVARLRRDQTLVGIAVVTATALLLDGIAHAWFPELYGTDPALVVKGAAAIFWGAGAALILAIIMNKEPVK
jgi:hypothetical protein